MPREVATSPRADRLSQAALRVRSLAVRVDDFDRFVAQLDTSLVVVTAAADGQHAGCVVGFHTQCSISPQRYAVWLSKGNLTYRVSLFATHLAVHLLRRDV